MVKTTFDEIEKMRRKQAILKSTRKNMLSRGFSQLFGSPKQQIRKISTGLEGTKKRPGVFRRIEYTRRRIQEGKITPAMRRKVLATKRAGRMLFPFIPAGSATATYQYQSQKGQLRGRGRPKGSYKYPGGVYEYRKLMRAQKAQARYAAMLQRAQIAQRYPQMVVRRMQGQAVSVPEDYTQIPTMSEPTAISGTSNQMYPEEMPQEPQKRPIATVFKSSGGSPYPPVNNAPLKPSRQTIPQGYVESVDAFTGRRFMKKLPPTERWAGG